MAWSLLAHGGEAIGINGGTTAGAGVLNSTGADFFVMTVHYYSNGPDPTVSDSRSLTWVGLTAQEQGSPPGTDEVALRFFYAKNATGGSGHTFTVSGTGIYTAIEVSAWSGSDLSAPFDQENGQFQNAPGTTSSPNSVTPTTDNQLVLWASTIFQSSATMTSSAGTELDETFSGTVYAGATYYEIQTTATARNPTQTHTSYKWASAIATFKSAAGGGGGGVVGKDRATQQAVMRAANW